MKRVIYFLSFLFSLVLYGNDAYSPIYPTTVTIDTGSGKKVQEFKIFNTSDKIRNFEIGVKDVDNFGKESILKDYVKIFPRKFSLKPGETKEIRVMIKDFPKELSKTGEHRGAILVKGLSSRVENQYETKDQKGITTLVDIQIDVSMAVYVLTGDEKLEIEIETKKIGIKGLLVDIKNKGNYSTDLLVKGYGPKGEEIEETYSVKVISGMNQSFALNKSGISTIKVFEVDKNKKQKLILEKGI